MRVPAVIYASEPLIRDMDHKVYEQAVNVAMLRAHVLTGGKLKAIAETGFSAADKKERGTKACAKVPSSTTIGETSAAVKRRTTRFASWLRPY